MTKQCLVCNEPFKPPRPDSRYCSRACYGKSLRGKPRTALFRRETKVCPVCGKDFEVGGRAGKRGQLYCTKACANRGRAQTTPCLECGTLCKRARKYCSRKCYHAAREKTVSDRLRTFTCATCGKSFERYVSLRTGKNAYCSADCYTGRVYPRGEDHPSWKGGTYMHNGYEHRVDPARVRRRDGAFRNRATHILVAEEALGRPLAKGEHVHHRNGDKLDNRPENLLVLTATKHRALHGFYSHSFQREHDAAGDLAELTREFLATLE